MYGSAAVMTLGPVAVILTSDGVCPVFALVQPGIRFTRATPRAEYAWRFCEAAVRTGPGASI